MVDIKVKELTFNDCICPICLSIQVEPVTLPCNHEFCMPCFRSSLELSNMTCPMCRVRISTWSRRAKRSNTLINRKKWAQIQLLFPDKIKQRLSQQDVDEVDGDIPFGQQPNKNIAKPGEIRQEYEDELRRLRDERNRQELEEMRASEELIKKLAKEESTSVDFWKKQQEIIEKDTFYAQALQKNPNLNLKNLMDSPRTTRSASCSALPQTTPSLLEKYLIRQKKKQNLADKIKRSRSAAEVLDSPRKEIDTTECEATRTSNSSSSTISVIVQGNPNNQSSAASTATLTSIQNNRCSTIRQLFKAELERGVKPANACENVTASTSSQTATKGTIRQYLTSLNVAGSSAGIDVKVNENIPASRSRSRSTESNDSISREINHFKPIHACMKTPPKRLPGGKFYEPKVVHSTPVNPSRPDLKTPPAHIDGVGSPVMQRMLSNLASERRNSIEKYSKSTSTDGNELLVKQSDGRRRMKHSTISKMKRWSQSLNESLTDDDEEDRGYVCNSKICKKVDYESKKGDEIYDSKKTLIGVKRPKENFDISAECKTMDAKKPKYSFKYDFDAHISNNNCEKDDHNEFSPGGTTILDNWLNSHNGSPDVFKNGAKSVIIKNENGRSNSSRSKAKDGKITAKSAPKRHVVVKNSKKLNSSKLSRNLNTLGVKRSQHGQLLTNTFGYQDDCEAEDDSSNDSKKLYIHMSDDCLSADNSGSSSGSNYVPHVVTLNKKSQRKNNNNKTSKKEKKTRVSNVDDDDGEDVDDHKLALRLQKSFDIEAKINASFTRPTEDYNLRRSTRRNKLV